MFLLQLRGLRPLTFRGDIRSIQMVESKPVFSRLGLRALGGSGSDGAGDRAPPPTPPLAVV